MIFALALAVWPGLAFAQMGSPTPEYSGPSAGFDRGFSDYGAARAAERRAVPALRRDQAIRRDDRGVDLQTRQRAVSVQSEMALQRENARRAAGAYRTNE